MLPHLRRPRARVLTVLAAVVAASLLSVPAQAATDTDGDGLPDAWEKKGKKAPGGLDIYKLGARANHRDVFVELNYTTATAKDKVTCAGLDALHQAFASSPLVNPDGKAGITLHVDAGKSCKSRSYKLKGSGTLSSKTFKPGACIYPTGTGLAKNRTRVFRNGIVAGDSQVCSAEGYADDSDFVVKRGTGGIDFAFVAMHELGHTFGLSHSPNRAFSVMSGGAFVYRQSGSAIEQTLDFQRYPILPLDEKALDEQTGYSTGTAAGDDYLSRLYAPQFCGTPRSLALSGRATGPVDWDCSGAPFWMPPYQQYISSTPVAADIDDDGELTVLPALAPEWPRLQLANGRVG